MCKLSEQSALFILKHSEGFMEWVGPFICPLNAQ